MDDGVNATEIDGVEFAHIALHDRESGRRGEIVTEPLDVEGDHAVALSQKLGHQHRSLVTASARDKNLHMHSGPASRATGRCWVSLSTIGLFAIQRDDH